MSNFSEDVVAAVTKHMNVDHPEDNLLVARAFGAPNADESVMIGVTSEAGVWRVTDPDGTRELTVPWPAGPITERPEVRREIVALYHAACERLGLPARDEHARGSARTAAGGAAAAGAPAADDTAASERAGDDRPFSVVIREGSWSDHSDSEGAGFMDAIMRGTATKQDFIDLVAQHYFMYEALEAVVDAAAGDPRLRGFHPDALVRLPAIRRDLEFLVGDDWRERISPVPATEAYAARIREVGAEGWIAGIVAHHYTRYLGDLSGGQMIARRVAKQHGFDGEGVEFYDFTGLGSPAAFKNAYRIELDRLGSSLDASERERTLEEVRTAYHFNTAVFDDLGRARLAA